MSDSLPLQLLAAWAIFFGLVSTHQRAAMTNAGASPTHQLALQISTLLGTLTILGLLIFYFFQVAWFWPIVLFFAGGLIGGLVFRLLERLIPKSVLSGAAFVGWPSAGVWAFFIMRTLGG